MKLLELKQQYEKLAKSYKLSSFDELNVDFEIEKLQDKETDFLLRNIRRCMFERVTAILRFLEILVNPTESPPIYVFSVIKSISPETKKIIDRTYKELISLELGSLDLDIDYNEKNEAKFIKEFSESWKTTKKDLKEITKKLGVVWGHEKMHDNYFG